MAQKDLNSNPFAELLNDNSQKTSAISIEKHLLNDDNCAETMLIPLDNSSIITVDQAKLKEDQIIENIFKITINPNKKQNSNQLYFLSQLHSNLNSRTFIDSECLSQAVFERLLIPKEEIDNLMSLAQKKSNKTDNSGKILHYLYACFNRLYDEIPDIEKRKNLTQSLASNIKDIIICNSATAMQTDLYSQDTSQQFIDLLLQNYTTSNNRHLNEYLMLTLSYINENYGYQTLYDSCKPILDKLYNLFSQTLTIINPSLFDYLEIITFYTQTALLARIFLAHSTPLFLIKLNGDAYNKEKREVEIDNDQINVPSNSAQNNTNISAFRQAFDRGLRNIYPLNSAAPTPTNSYGIGMNHLEIGKGKMFENTLLGRIIGISCIPIGPKSNGSLFFNNVSQLSRQEHKSMEQNIWKPLSSLVDKIYSLFYSLLKMGSEVKHETLRWIGYCLHCNAGRSKIWSSQVPEIFASTYASDPFMLNLGSILIKLCKPFSYPFSNRILKIEIDYTQTHSRNDLDAKSRGLHMLDLDTETFLVPTKLPETSLIRTDDKLNTKEFNFVTECLFMTQKCMDIGFRVILSKFLKLNQELGRMQVYYESLLSSASLADESAPPIRNIKDAMEKGLSTFLSTKAALLEPHFLEGFFNLNVAISQYLCHNIHLIISKTLDNNKESADMHAYFSAPLEDELADEDIKSRLEHFMSCVPEFFLENMLDLMSLLSHFSDESLEFFGVKSLEPIMILIMTLMGCPERVKNPHLRAKMAETLEALVPLQARKSTDDDREGLEAFDQGYSSGRNWSLGGGGINATSSCRSQLFTIGKVNNIAFQIESPKQNIDYRNFMIPVLIHVFVSIEETGHNVAFEQKFSYRRPMYVVLRYLWKFTEHRNVVKFMADQAEKNIEAINPPLFLRFINLLINDAIFLLDEGLSFMSQLRELQMAKDKGEWHKLSQEQKTENENNFQHLGLMARYHNVLGLETIRVLAYVTRYIHTIFTHSTMVNRITSMLNYFLLHLVGPKKKNLKVKDLSIYEFRPQEIVTTICQIYVNLGNSVENYLKGQEIFLQNMDASSSSTINDLEKLKISEEEFLRAVSHDGRSYSAGLFTQALDVLQKIGNKAASTSLNDSFSSFSTYTMASNLSSQLDIVAQKVKNFAVEQEQEDELMADAPDEFLDPIMNTLMINPVILPTSGKVVDRSTIARHLLSDQNDPFNRLPLALEMVKSDFVLKEKIEQWKSSKRN
ncbi:unnamed protein product [Gordionus sp. m RMFG-2023]|uniref:ubiquitin conjugation factor E4 A-like n=1 Tax=Gordionus sp. m RMFG-2023 TaxID=3053472 RepID=UPI0030DFE634